MFDAMLTGRELDVLALIAGRNSNRAAAETLGVGAETVKGHVKSILAKLGARDRTHAVTLALRGRGIIGSRLRSPSKGCRACVAGEGSARSSAATKLVEMQEILTTFPDHWPGLGLVIMQSNSRGRDHPGRGACIRSHRCHVGYPRVECGARLRTAPDRRAVEPSGSGATSIIEFALAAGWSDGVSAHLMRGIFGSRDSHAGAGRVVDRYEVCSDGAV